MIRTNIRNWTRHPVALLLMGIGLLSLLAMAVLLLRARLFPSDPVWARVQRTGVWRVGLDPSFPPFEMVNEEGQVVGYDVDLARAIAEQWGVRVEFVGVGFDGLIDAVKAGRIDAAISAIPYDPLLTKDVRFSAPYFDAGWRIVVLRDASLRSEEDLAGKRVAVEWGSEGDVWARRLQRTQSDLALVLKPSLEEALAALRAGEADAAIVDGVIFQLYRKELRQVGETLSHEPYVIVVAMQAHRLHEEVNTTLETLEKSGVLDSLRRRWFDAG